MVSKKKRERKKRGGGQIKPTAGRHFIITPDRPTNAPYLTSCFIKTTNSFLAALKPRCFFFFLFRHRIIFRPSSSMSLTSLLCSVIIIKDLIRVLQNGINHSHLPSSVGNIRARSGAHEGRAENDGQVLRAHPIGARVLHDAMQVQRQGAKCCVVGIREIVDNGM